MNGRKMISRTAALLLAVLPAASACVAAGAAEEKAPGMITSAINSEIVIPSTLPLGYYAEIDGRNVFLRDANDTKIDGKWQTESEPATVLSLERISGDLSAPKCQAVNVSLGFVRLNGNLSGKPKIYPLLYAAGKGRVEVNGTVPEGMDWKGSVFVNGLPLEE